MTATRAGRQPQRCTVHKNNKIIPKAPTRRNCSGQEHHRVVKRADAGDRELPQGIKSIWFDVVASKTQMQTNHTLPPNSPTPQPPPQHTDSAYILLADAGGHRVAGHAAVAEADHQLACVEAGPGHDVGVLAPHVRKEERLSRCVPLFDHVNANLAGVVLCVCVWGGGWMGKKKANMGGCCEPCQSPLPTGTHPDQRAHRKDVVSQRHQSNHRRVCRGNQGARVKGSGWKEH